MSEPVSEIAYWARRMDDAQNRVELFEAWARWSDAIGASRGETPTPDRQAERLLTGQEP